MYNIFEEITRWQLMQTLAWGTYMAGMPGLTGCASVPAYKPGEVGRDRTLFLTNGHVVDVVTGKVLQKRTLVIINGIIETVTTRKPTPREGDVVVDLQGGYVIPGLIDAHCHSTLPGASALGLLAFPTVLRQIERNYTQQLRQGVTTIRDMGALPLILHERIRQIEQGSLSGPRVVYCNAFTNIYGSHPDIDVSGAGVLGAFVTAFTGNSNLWFRDTDDLEARMLENIEGGASFIKLTMDKKSLLCGKGDIPVYSDEQLQTITRFAKERNLKTAAHIHTKFGFDRAVEFGIDSMEHTIADAPLSQKEIEAMAQKNIAIVPTLTIAQLLAAPEGLGKAIPAKYRNDFIDRELGIRQAYLASSPDDYIDPSIHRDNIAHLENYTRYGCSHLYDKSIYMANPEIYFDILSVAPKNLMAMKDAGIVIGCGTDAGVPFSYHGTLWREMEMLARAGLTHAEVLRAATLNNAMILGLSDTLGTLESGKIADCIILQDNPLENLETCRTPRQVIKEGKVYDVGEGR